MKFIWMAATAVLVLGARLALSSPADAQEPPEITYIWSEDGHALEQRPTCLRMCFAERVESRESTDESDDNGMPTADNDDGPDVLLLALLTVGTAGVAGIVGLLGYVLRNRIGFWLHRPPERHDNDPQEHG